MRDCTCTDCKGRFASKEPFKLDEADTCSHCKQKSKMLRPNVFDWELRMCRLCLNCGKCNSIWHCHCFAKESHYTSYYYDDEDQEDHVAGHCSECGHHFDIMCPSDETINQVKECSCD